MSASISLSDGVAAPADPTNLAVSPISHRLGLILVALAGLLAAGIGLSHQQITGLDQAHNIVSSIFFYDALHDLPVSDPVGYTYDYYRQYPALGFTFWPPLFHATAGFVMLATGPGIVATRVTLALFTVLLAVCFYLCLRRGCRPGTAVLATGVMLTVPLLIELENSVMLEIPMMAMVCLTLVAYFRLIDRGHWTGWREAVVAALLSAAVVYTKQPGVFILPALLLDLAWNHRHILRQRQTWLMIGLVVLLCLPLGIFTLTYGRVNMQQSFGNAGNIYIEHHRVADRWSIDGWTYYLREIALHVDAILCGLAAAGALAILWSSDLRRRHAVWLAYAVCWYVLFTLFDNKQTRFVGPLVPGLVALSAIGLSELRRVTPRVAWAGPVALAVLLGYQTSTARAYAPRGYPGVRELAADLVQPNLDGHVLFFSGDYQLFIPWVRMLDQTHKVHVLRGDDLLADSASLSSVLHDYRIRYVCVDPQTVQGKQFTEAADPQTLQTLESAGRREFDNGLKAFRLDVYRYTGDVAASMSHVELYSALQGIDAE